MKNKVIKKYDKFENLNFLKVKTNNTTGIIIGKFSANHTALSNGFIANTTNSIM
ncbi:hypothetical protein RBH94_13565 [Aestuariibaculum sp. YM273]|uniref:hypothetical protein n=1 Tax=Aestuariibaculum sp. YM273 TaxID=3070659 RepID=UPI0027DD2EDD|nr:hypothetical protein [Aestuariibaculum sp. YM273]WMI67139.1 hypothetical protein RBH94_13565 [Aestuariibaculum sp. YM273]